MKAAGRASGPGRQDCGRREASLRPPSSSCDDRLIVGGVVLHFGGAAVGNCSPTVVFWTGLLGSTFLAVIVSWLSTSGILFVDSPLIKVVVVLLAMWRFAFVVRSSRLWALPSLWGLAYTPGKFSLLQGGASFAIIVSWQSSSL